MRTRSLWRCPRCGRRLPQPNAVHACAPPVPLAVHFRGKSPRVRQLFQSFRQALGKIGRVAIDSTKTRIAFRVWTNFVELTPQKNALRGFLLLPRPMNDRRFFRVLSLSPRIHYHYFKLTEPKQLDSRFRRLLAEAYKVGRREHLRQPIPKARFVAAASSRQPPAREEKRAPARPLWQCPRCRKRFANRNQWHSCVRLSLEHHFHGKDPRLRRLFEWLLAAVRRNGPVRVTVSKTRIEFLARIRFGGVQVKQEGLQCSLLLPRPTRERRFFRIIPYTPRAYGHSFWLRQPSDIDPRLRRYLAQAYRVGRQEHLRASREEARKGARGRSGVDFARRAF